MSSLKLSNLSKSYGQAEILKKINLDIVAGEFLVLVGPSGCGKSTTLRLIAGLEEVTEGEVFIGNEMVNGLDPSKRDIAMVFQNYALYPHMTVFENMAFGLRLRKFSNAEIEKRVGEAAEILMLKDYLGRRPKELSGGQRQRVALGRAIVRQPKVFLFDEPLSNLDAKLRGEMRVEINKLHQLLGTTMIYVTHDQTEAMTMGDRIAVMNDGILEQLDSPQDLYNLPKNRFVASFIGSPEMNFFTGKIVKDIGFYFKNDGLKVKIPDGHPQIAQLKEAGIVLLGIRPEDVHDEFWAEIKNSESILPAQVELVENLGSNVIAHCHAGGNLFSANLKKSSDIQPQSKVNLIFDMQKSHFFHSESGEIL